MMATTARRRRTMMRRVRNIIVAGVLLIVGVSVVGAFVDGRIPMPGDGASSEPGESGTPAAAPDAGAQIAASELPDLLRVADETRTPKYSRDRFEHWIDADGDGCSTRFEVLIEESTTPVTITGQCTLTGGTWVSPLDGMYASSPTEIEIDHHVPLAEAWRSGASAWTDDTRRDFANDLDVPYALTAASSVSNQSKGDKDPAKWLPSNTSYTCEYVLSWSLVKYRWSLAVDPAEDAAIREVLSGECGATVVTLPDVRA